MAGAHRHAFAIENGGHVVRVHAFGGEGKNRALAGGVADHPDPGKFRHLFAGIGVKRILVRPRRLSVECHQPFERRGQSVCLQDRRCARLEAGGRIGIGHAVLRHFADHLASAFERPHGGEEFAFGVKRADAGGAVEFMAGDGIEIDAEILYVHVHMHRRLTAVGKDGNALLMGAGDDLLQRRHGSEHVRHVGDGDELGLRSDRGVHRICGKRAVFGHIHPFQHRALAFAQEMPRHDVGMMLHHGKHDLVAGLDARGKPGIGNEVDRLGAALGEDDLVRMRRMEEPAHGLARVLVGFGRTGGEIMHPAVHVGVVFGRKRMHRIKHRGRLLGRRGAVQVNQRLAVDGARENGKLAAGRNELSHGTVSIACWSAVSTSRQISARKSSSAISSTASPRKARMRRSRASVSERPRDSR